MDLQLLEEISLLAWPAHQQVFYDGWILRFSEGYTKRANSVNSTKPSSIDLEAKVATCEKVYRERGLPTIFRITPLSSPTNLDEFLEKRGYQILDPTSVLTRDLIRVEFQEPQVGKLISQPLDVWLEIFCNIRGESLTSHQSHLQILKSMPEPRIFATLMQDEQSSVCGVGTIVDGYFGMFDLLTDPEHRGKGMGTAFVLWMLHWAKERGANFAYLQVVKRNKVAMRLYNKLGFKEAYSYWYRILR
jgi:GNAT superfamily N-acetyltransferase